MDLAGLQQLLQRVAGARVVAVGDLMVDRFVYGDVTRVSPEAPILVMARSRDIVMLGGAGNVARNVAALGGEVALVAWSARTTRAAKPRP
jgi:D-beta-D-heptose 7-phosphate kinase/D-beta-D-heptose 1-phosphate adenosyltransferase